MCSPKTLLVLLEQFALRSFSCLKRWVISDLLLYKDYYGTMGFESAMLD